MDDQKKPSESSESLLISIFKDCWKTIFIPESKRITTNFLVDCFYALADTASNTVQRKINKDGAPIQSRSRPNQQQTGYSNRFSQVNGTKSQTQPQQPNIGMRSSATLQYVVAPDPVTADRWKRELIESIQRYNRVFVNELYEKAGLKTMPSDFDFGWTKVEDIHYVRNRDGCWFNLPNPEKLR